LYDLYLEKELLRIIEVAEDDLDFDLDIKNGLADPYIKL